MNAVTLGSLLIVGMLIWALIIIGLACLVGARS